MVIATPHDNCLTKIHPGGITFLVRKMEPTFTFSSLLPPDPRCGFHYYPDTLHYREVDLQAWLPELVSMGVSWIVLRSELDRAIPEGFLRGIKQAGIQPIIQFQLSLDGMPALRDVGTLLDVYARWGARYVLFYDRPNSRCSWPTLGWVQQDLVERFLDRFLPLANLALYAGMIPVFPPLEPGGSYWDTAFLRSALQAMQRRKQDLLLRSLVLSAYGWTGGHSLDWGNGGPKAWPQARPYLNSQQNQDQRGFRVFDWYQSIAGSVLEQNVPVILFQAGLPGSPETLSGDTLQSAAYLETCKSITRLLAGETVPDPLSPDKSLAPLPPQVIACNFWIFDVDSSGALLPQAWCQAGGKRLEFIRWLDEWRQSRCANQKEEQAAHEEEDHPIRHYLLLPGFEWGVSDWYLEIIRPFVKKHLPAVGFSPKEAERAEMVTVVGNPQNYPEDLLPRLRKAGCKVEQISGDGTQIASELAER